MNHSEEIAEIAKALVKAQALFPSANKDSNNPHFKSTYSSLSAVQDAIRGPLTSNGISYLQLPTAGEGWVSVETILLHESGQWISSILQLPIKGDTPHIYGTGLTYCKRYGLQAIVSLSSSDDDDDGNAASGGTRRAPPPPKQEVQEPPNDEVFTRFRLNVEEGLKKINDAVALKAAETITWKRMGEFKCSDEQYAAMEGIFQHKAAEVGPAESKPKRKAPPPTQGRSAEPYVQEAPRSYETQRKLFIEQVDGLSDYDEVASCWETMINAYSKDFFPPDMSEAQALLRSYEKKLAP
jgi:ERF superfamily